MLEDGQELRRPLLIRFHDKQGKSTFFKNCFKLKGWKQKVRVCNDIPPSLRGWNSLLEDEARVLRKKGMKSRIVYQGDALKLQIKNQKQKWENFEVQV